MAVTSSTLLSSRVPSPLTDRRRPAEVPCVPSEAGSREAAQPPPCSRDPSCLQPGATMSQPCTPRPSCREEVQAACRGQCPPHHPATVLAVPGVHTVPVQAQDKEGSLQPLASSGTLDILPQRQATPLCPVQVPHDRICERRKMRVAFCTNCWGSRLYGRGYGEWAVTERGEEAVRPTPSSLCSPLAPGGHGLCRTRRLAGHVLPRCMEGSMDPWWRAGLASLRGFG